MAENTDSTVGSYLATEGRQGFAPPSCLVARVREDLRNYRRRLQFLAVNIQLSDPGARELLTEVLSFDRWYAAHLQRCQDCRQGVQHP